MSEQQLITRVTGWIDDGDSSYRALEVVEGFVHHKAWKVAVIEKTPRVRIRSYGQGAGPDHDHLNWVEGDKGEGPGDPSSRRWCDAVLELVGVHLPDTNGMTKGEMERMYKMVKRELSKGAK